MLHNFSGHENWDIFMIFYVSVIDRIREVAIDISEENSTRFLRQINA